MNAENGRVIAFPQVEPDHWIVDVCTRNDDTVELKWVPPDNRYGTRPHWLIFVSATSSYNLPKLIAQALNLLEHKKEEKLS